MADKMTQGNDGKHNSLDRRGFIKLAATTVSAVCLTHFLKACQAFGITKPSPTLPESPQTPAIDPSPSLVEAGLEETMAEIAFVKTRDRSQGVQQVLDILGINPLQGKRVLLKPNFNSADPAPASTHIDTLRALVEACLAMGSAGITIGDRSGMGHSRDVMQSLGVLDLAQELGVETLSFEELQAESDWELVLPKDSHWKQGFPFARPCLEADAIVQTCCLKPHRYGGHFTLSLKNTIGMVGKYLGSGGHNYMNELHSSSSQRLMIAETNVAYSPALVLLDGVEAFIDRGPDVGTKVWGDLIIAGTDRVAIDAVGLAALRFLGLSGEAARGAIFDQEQIARAVELGLGVERPEHIQLLTADDESRAYADQIQEVLLA